MFDTNLIVAKFGGTSVANYDAMCRCIDIVLANAQIRLVVLSASAGVTNLLLELARGQEQARRHHLLNELRCIQYAILEKLPTSNSCLHEKVDSLLANVALLAEAAALANSNALTDELICHGELISTRLFVEIARQRQANVQWFDIRAVMHTNDQFGRATPDTTLLKRLAEQHLHPLISSSCIVTQGFIGRETKGRTTTLGRGGSDYSAALLGEALDATRVDIWTDVAGIYTIDPRIEANAIRIDSISFEEASELATFGAKVLHPATLVPAIRHDIPVFVGSSQAPEMGGTIVYNKTKHTPLFRAIAIRRQQTLLTLHSLTMLHAHGFLAEAFAILARHQISVDIVTTSEVSIALTLDNTGSTNVNGALMTADLMEDLVRLGRVEVEENLALVALIGNQLSQVPALGKRVFDALEAYNLRLICYGASSHNLCFLVADNESEQVARTLHNELFATR